MKIGETLLKLAGDGDYSDPELSGDLEQIYPGLKARMVAGPLPPEIQEAQQARGPLQVPRLQVRPEYGNPAQGKLPDWVKGRMPLLARPLSGMAADKVKSFGYQLPQRETDVSSGGRVYLQDSLEHIKENPGRHYGNAFGGAAMLDYARKNPAGKILDESVSSLFGPKGLNMRNILDAKHLLAKKHFLTDVPAGQSSLAASGYGTLRGAAREMREKKMTAELAPEIPGHEYRFGWLKNPTGNGEEHLFIADSPEKFKARYGNVPNFSAMQPQYAKDYATLFPAKPPAPVYPHPAAQAATNAPQPPLQKTDAQAATNAPQPPLQKTDVLARGPHRVPPIQLK